MEDKRIDKYTFNLGQLLGQGSYASVYRGKVIATGQPVAVKVIEKRMFTSAFSLKNLHSQIEIMKKVSHRNIVRLFGVYQTNNNMYIVTQLCDCDLYGLLKNKRKVPEVQAVKYLKQILQGVKYLNINNIIHRDLKPANILLKGRECKLSDFGFAKNVDSDDSFLRSIVGTPLYMSPQLLQKEKYTNKSDLWSVGLIFYQMLHGRTPWMAVNQLQLIKGIYNQKIAYSKLISDLAKDFISRCLMISEEKRLSWDEAFEHPLIKEQMENTDRLERQDISKNKSQRCLKLTIENRSALLFKGQQNQPDIENNSHVSNFNHTMNRQDFKKDMMCHTPKMVKNLSEIKLKKVQALTPKASFTNINNKLKQVWALNSNNYNKTPLIKREDKSREADKSHRKRHFTTLIQPRQNK